MRLPVLATAKWPTLLVLILLSLTSTTALKNPSQTERYNSLELLKQDVYIPFQNRRLQEATDSPTNSPTTSPTFSPTGAPTSPTEAPTSAPTDAPTSAPTEAPAPAPTEAPAPAPTVSPTTSDPTQSPTGSPIITEAPAVLEDGTIAIIAAVTGVLLIVLVVFASKSGGGRTVDTRGEGGPEMLEEGTKLRRPSSQTNFSMFSRDRFSTISGRHSDKFEAEHGKDGALIGYVRDQRHKRNLKKEKRNKNKAMQTGSRRSTVNSLTSAQGRVNSRQQAPAQPDAASLQEVTEEDEGVTDTESV